jgi:hypothetical protein
MTRLLWFNSQVGSRLMASLREDIAAFDRMKAELEVSHFHEWAVFHEGKFVDAFSDFEAAATMAVDRFGDGPYLIRQVGAGSVQLPGGMIFRPAHALDTGGL